MPEMRRARWTPKAAASVLAALLPSLPGLRRARSKKKRERVIADYLEQIGYVRSNRERRPVDGSGGPLPWYTYGSIFFLEKRISPAFNVFEYGCGNSTLWWAARSASVTSCEHSPQWVAQMRRTAPPNVTIVERKLRPDGDYCRAILAEDRLFDIVVNDGRDRVNCATHIVERLSPRGVIVWDNADRERYQAGYDFLTELGFRRVDFIGIGPINWRGWTTSIFYRDGNCLGL